MRRAQMSDNYELMRASFILGGASPMCAVEGEATFTLSAAPAVGKRVQHEMQIDYPSPVDGAPFDWTRN